MSQQLVFDLRSSYPPTLANFEPGANAEVLSHLDRVARGRASTALTYLWGPAGAGKSHLATAVFQEAPSHGLRAFWHDNASLSELDTGAALDGPGVVHVLDDVVQLNEAARAGLFALINLARLSPTLSIVVTGPTAPAALTLKPELVSRLTWGLVFQLQLLEDPDKAAALARLAAERGVSMSTDVVPYLLTHTARDMRALRALFDRLDQFALARNRAITLPLLREFLQLRLDEH